jgi:hypothetical protein
MRLVFASSDTVSKILASCDAKLVATLFNAVGQPIQAALRVGKIIVPIQDKDQRQDALTALSA